MIPCLFWSQSSKSAVVLTWLRVFRRRKENKHSQVFNNRVKAVLDIRRYIDRRAGLDRAILITDADRSTPLDDVINLILGVRLLGILAACWQDVQPRAETRHADELKIAIARLCLLLQQ